jgi:hypothetical protein
MRCYPKINGFCAVHHIHSLSPNDEFVPNSTRLSIKTALTNPGFSLLPPNSSQLAKRYPAASIRVAAIRVPSH